MRFQLPDAALAVFYQAGRSGLTRAVNEIRPLPAGRGFAVPGKPGVRMHDVTALRTEDIEDLLHRHPDIRAKVDSGYQGMARDFPNQVTAPPKKPGKDASADEIGAWETERKAQSSARSCVEHAIAEPKKWRPLQRWIGRREHLALTAQAIATLVSDRCAIR